MSVLIGSARIDENGRISGGKAGDQTGKEVSTQSWYKHSKGWRVFRANDPEKAALIAQAMRAACSNNKIGYDQGGRNTLWKQVKDKGYDPAKATEACETDCSALVRLCCAFAGILLADFTTASEPSVLLKSKAFCEMSASKYTTSSDYLCPGDILVTKVKGHTAVVLTLGAKATARSTAKTLIVAPGRWNLRTAPGTGSSIVATIDGGRTATINSTDSGTGWYNVTLDGKTGWLSPKGVQA